MIRLAAVRKDYGDFVLDLDFSVRKGEFVSLLGPSGSGKTTALRIIAGFEKPDSGAILLEGRDVTSLDPADRRIGFVFQDYTLFPHLDVAGNVAFGLRKLAAEERRARTERFLALVGLAGYGQRRVHTLSGGEQQRVALARALAPEPLVLMLDEPFSSVDTMIRKELKEEILHLQREVGVTTIFITHDREEALSVSDRVILLREGRIVQAGTPEDIYSKPADPFTAAFTGTANFFSGSFLGRRDGLVRIGGTAGFLVSDPTDKTSNIPAARPDRVGLPVLTAAAEGAAEVTFMVRAERLRFSEEGRPNAFPAVIAEKRCYGHYWEYFCSAAGRKLSLISGDGSRKPGPVVLGFAPEDGIVVEVT